MPSKKEKDPEHVAPGPLIDLATTPDERRRFTES